MSSLGHWHVGGAYTIESRIYEERSAPRFSLGTELFPAISEIRGIGIALGFIVCVESGTAKDEFITDLSRL